MSIADWFRRSRPTPPATVEIPTVTTVVKHRDHVPEPTWAKAREVNGIKREYPAGEWTDLTHDWGVTPQTSYSVTLRYLTTLRGRARNEYQKNDYARRFVNMLQNGVVGPQGFQLQAHFENPDGTLDDTANRAFEAHWLRWAKDPRNCDVRQRSNFTSMQRQMVHQLAVDGEIMLRRYRRGPMGYQLQLLDPQLVDVTYHDTNNVTGNQIMFGVEVDDVGAIVAYYINTAMGEARQYVYQTGERVRVPASEIYHGYLSEMVDQLRGLPWISTPSYRLHMLDGFEEASLVNARAGASKMGFRKTLEPERYEGDENETAGGKQQIELYSPGMTDELGQNEEWVSYDPTYPQGEFKDYVRQVLRGVASGLMVSYPTLANDLEGVNYTSLRHDALQERDVYMAVQHWFSDHLLMPIYHDWLRFMLAQNGGIPIPRRGGGSRQANPGRIEKYKQVRFQGRRWQWVDPLKEVQAQKTAIELGITTRAQVILETGRDPAEVLRDVETERERFGLPDGSNTSAGGSETDSAADEDTTGGSD